MIEEPLTEASARRFLLGDVDDAQREKIESRFMNDPQAKTTILLAEEELIENFLEHNLPTSDYEKFLRQYGSTPYQRRKIRISRSIKQWASVEDRRNPSGDQPWRLSFSHLLKTPWRVAVAAAMAIVIVVGIGYLWQLNSRRLREIRQHESIERKLAELNGPDRSNPTPGQLLSLTLAPVSVRSLGSQNELTVRSDTPTVELHLVWTEKKVYISYRAVIRRLGAAEQFTVSNLTPESRGAGSQIRLKLPSSLLAPGLYQITLSGVDRAGTASQTEEYSFQARN